MQLNTFLSMVYLNTMGSILITLITGYASIWLDLNPLALLMVGTIGNFMAISMFDDRWRIKENTAVNAVIEYPFNSVIASYLLPLFMGFFIAPIMMYAELVDSSILPTAMVMSLIIFGTATLYAFTTEDNKILTWRQSLYTISTSMIFIGLISILFPTFGRMWFTVAPYIGLVLFSCFIIYDTYKAKVEFGMGNYNYLAVSITLYLDFINIFIRVVKILIKIKEEIDKKKKKE